MKLKSYEILWMQFLNNQQGLTMQGLRIFFASAGTFQHKIKSGHDMKLFIKLTGKPCGMTAACSRA